MTRQRLAVIIALLVSLAACGSSGGSAARPTTLTILAAASLKDALANLETAYETANPGVAVTVSTDSSAALRTQIEQGAPADVYLSADTTNPQKLVDDGFAEGEAVDFAGNLLVIVIPKDNPARIASPADLARRGVKVIAAGTDVPITKYAEQVVGLLAKEAGYPAAFAAGYAANVVSREDNVKAVVAKVELGEGDAGIVYVTDAAASTKVATIPIPAEANVPATYGGVVVSASKQHAAAHAFLNWLTGADAQVILAGFGFRPPPA
jgi:molybdate transport system substrate-binding protein